ncbi:MAG TPA: type II secretion system F family protein [Solirubrobacteraceae bacterium]|nr:type II secretion system F family protein [Solirubrobacteraceae bacterium]
MFLILLLGLVLVAATAAFVVRAATLPQLRVGAQLQQIETYGFAREGEDVAAPRRTVTTLLTSLAVLLGRLVTARTRLVDLAKVRAELLGAGMYGTRPEAVVGYQVLGAGGMAALTAQFATTQNPALGILLFVLGTATAGIAPRSVLGYRSRARLDEIDRTMPDLIDLVVVMIEAGQGFNGALQLASERLHGPLSDELRLATQEQRMGLSVQEALVNMSNRCATPSVQSFVRSVVQGDSLGVSIGTMMRNLAVDTRKRRRQIAEERIQKAPVKMLFPLVLLIFPAMFIVLLGPAAFNVLDAFGGM